MSGRRRRGRRSIDAEIRRLVTVNRTGNESRNRSTPVLTTFKRTTKYAAGGMIATSLETPSADSSSHFRLPTEPPDLVATTPETLRFTWKNPFASKGRPALRNELQISRHPRDWHSPRTLVVAESHAQVDKLRPSTMYWTRVRIYDGRDWSAWSYPPTTGRTQAVRPPDRVGECTLSTPNNAVLTTVIWDPPYAGGAGKLLGYEVRLHLRTPSGEWEEKHFETGGEATRCNIGHLHPSCYYRVAVRAKNMMGFGEWGLEVEHKAGGKASVPEAVDYRTIKLKSRTRETITFQWEPPESIGAWIDDYVVQTSADCVTWSRHLHTIEPAKDFSSDPSPIPVLTIGELMLGSPWLACCAQILSCLICCAACLCLVFVQRHHHHYHHHLHHRHHHHPLPSPSPSLSLSLSPSPVPFTIAITYLSPPGPKNVKPDERVYVRVKAHNVKGWGRYSQPVWFRTSGE